MSGLRVSLAVPGATAAEVVETARLAEHWNLASIWIGAADAARHCDDSYVTATAGAVTAVTSHLRIGVFLRLGVAKQVVRLAEDLAVLDQASNGRMETAFVPAGDREAWLTAVASLVDAYHGWPVPGSDELLPVVPGPVQPEIPRLVVDDLDAANLLRAGRMVAGPPRAEPGLLRPRTVLRRSLPRDVRAWLADDVVAAMLELRVAAREASARELLLVADSPPGADDIELLGTVVVPALRCADRDVRAIAVDAWTWATAKRHLHAPPGV